MVTSDAGKDAPKDSPKPVPVPVKKPRSNDDDDKATAAAGGQKFLPTGLSRAIVLAAVIASVVIGGASLFAHRYELVPAPNSANGFMYRIDNLTGAVQFCGPQGCSPLPPAK